MKTFIISFLALALLSACQKEGFQHSSMEFILSKDCCSDLVSVAKNRLNLTFEDVDIAIATADVNNDDLTDFFAQIQSPLHCGSSGCETYLFLANNGEYSVQSLFNTSDKIILVDNAQGSFRDLIVTGKDDKMCQWSWLENNYEFMRCD